MRISVEKKEKNNRLAIVALGPKQIIKSGSVSRVLFLHMQATIIYLD